MYMYNYIYTVYIYYNIHVHVVKEVVSILGPCSINGCGTKKRMHV